jgi:hypothetical protein
MDLVMAIKISVGVTDLSPPAFETEKICLYFLSYSVFKGQK